ncbi:MAG: OmpA family protein, partial [Gelidibacter sp.]
MKNSISCKKLLGTALLLLFMLPSANAQILKRLQKSAERTVERKLERKTEKETGKVMDSILDPSQKSSTKKSTTKNSENPNNKPTSNNNVESKASNEVANSKNVSEGLEVYSKFDFVPGDKILFFDDFSQDFVGDFPSKWNTNGSGEVVKINNVDGNWFELKSGHNTLYIPDLKGLPEDYTIEFDVLTQGLSNKTSSSSYLEFYLSDNNALNRNSDNHIHTSIPLYQNNPYSIHSRNRFNGKTGGIDSNVNVDIRKELLNQPHVAIAVTKNRYRIWINERKTVDIPRMIEKENVLKHLKFSVIGLKDEV